MMKVALSFLLALSVTGAVQAAPTAPLAAQIKAARANYDQCMDKSDGTNTAWAGCGGRLLQADDTILNAAWKSAYGDLDRDSKPALLAEQRAWLAYKDKACRWYLVGQGREGQVLHFPLCVAGVVETRINDLAAIHGFLHQDGR